VHDLRPVAPHGFRFLLGPALLRSKRARYLNTGEASEALGGLISAGLLRKMALAGEIPGAIRIRTRVYIPRRALEGLVIDLEFHNAAPPLPRIMVHARAS
jgi:hypothetical protein